MIGKLVQRLLVVAFLFIPLSLAWAQEGSVGATYLVQAGDTLWSIAQRFRVSVSELAALNNLQNPNQLTAGTELLIPAIEGFSGRLTAVPLALGENLAGVSRKFEIPIELLMRLNHIVTSNEMYAGASLVLPQDNLDATPLPCLVLPEDLSLLELAILTEANPWEFAVQNQLTQTVQILPGEPYRGGIEAQGEVMSELACPFVELSLSPTRLLQGKTGVIRLRGRAGMSLRAHFMNRMIPFVEELAGEYVLLVGVHAMAQPGLYPLEVQWVSGDTVEYAFSQMVNVGKVDYPYDNPLTVDPETIDPAVTEPENKLWASYAQAFTPTKYWQGEFVFPSPLSKEYCLTSGDCWSSRFGNRRSYNGSTYDYFHTGLDIVGREGTEIYAPADGVVVFAGSLTVRGKATMIDHGWGVFTGYYHQKEIYVRAGERVEAGQLIGLVGSTGRSQGPHLHFEVWVNGVQVDPLDWLSQTYP
ncbi:MAG: peptidoglycan DD-metalloendopeptidase family protein [Anaerolineales bacterium]|nr:peptidoglycan DD-metalloendopeptidase family protein [Anaerolineales bacterium]MDW8448160.1 peptidoglycan DD-metalloendopeptidase family protein [Anaerolineales bacterium]